MQRCHPMPFGVEVRNDRCVCFRLWAPRANRVDLCLEQDAPEIIRVIVGEPEIPPHAFSPRMYMAPVR
jgi:1,4-alpha-glucan branching enzyme/maltooligosyltrehalose trehalohydrolase